jgi:phage tail protein X/uncharacterized membrane protein
MANNLSYRGSKYSPFNKKTKKNIFQKFSRKKIAAIVAFFVAISLGLSAFAFSYITRNDSLVRADNSNLPQLGVVYNSIEAEDVEFVVQRMGDLNMNWIRIEFDSRNSYEHYAEIFQKLRDRNINVLMVASFGSVADQCSVNDGKAINSASLTWYHPEEGDSARNLSSDSDDPKDAYANKLTNLLDCLNEDSALPQAVEIFNEPHGHGWAGYFDHLVNTTLKAKDTIKSRHPSVKVISPGTAGFEPETWQRLNGLGDWMDAFAYHPYGRNNGTGGFGLPEANPSLPNEGDFFDPSPWANNPDHPFSQPTTNFINRVGSDNSIGMMGQWRAFTSQELNPLVANNSKPIWLTELGADSKETGQNKQAQVIHEIINTLGQMNGNPLNIEVAFLYNFKDTPTDSKYFGLFSVDRNNPNLVTKKPQYCVIERRFSGEDIAGCYNGQFDLTQYNEQEVEGPVEQDEPEPEDPQPQPPAEPDPETLSGDIPGPNFNPLNNSGGRCFEETGKCIDGAIKEYWEQNGGLPVFGFPITHQRQEQVEDLNLQVQWFQRDRLEIHSDGVKSGRLGDEYLLSTGRNWFEFPKPSSPSSGCEMMETGHTICEPFLSEYNNNGGLERFGFPLSEQMDEELVNGQESKNYTVQYFERRRMEDHRDEDAGILYGLLGCSVFIQRSNSPAGSFPGC